MVEYPWPESQEGTEARVRGLVESVLEPTELQSLRLEWVTPEAHRSDRPEAGWVALRLTVGALDDAVFSREIWGPDWPSTWNDELEQLASGLEDWVCETPFAWGQPRIARVPD